MNPDTRVVVTGMGLISSLGDNVDTFFTNALAGKVSIQPVSSIDTSRMKSNLGGEAPSFVTEGADYRDRAKLMAVQAAKQIFSDSRIQEEISPFRFGVAFGFTQGDARALEDFTDLRAEQDNESARDAFKSYPPKLISQRLAQTFNLYGPNYTLGQACSAGNFCIGLALETMKDGDADAMLVGGADAFSRYIYAGFSRLGAIAEDACRPFSKDRQGMVPAEGAGVLLLETLESAQKRGAKIYAEIVGYGESSDAHHITQPSVDGVSQAMFSALEEAELKPTDIDYVSVHGTGTGANDRTESAVMHQVFSDQKPPLSSIKSLIGHTMGAASTIETIATVMAMNHGEVPPTMGYLGVDPECEVDCIANEKRAINIQHALKTASAFGGQNAAVIFRQWNQEEEHHVK